MSHVTQAPAGEKKGVVPFESDWNFSFAPNGSSAVDSTSIEGPAGVSVARTGTGTFRCTLPYGANAITCASATLQLATPDDKSCQIGATSASSGYVDVVVWDNSGAAATDVAANAGNRINVRVTVRGSDRKRF